MNKQKRLEILLNMLIARFEGHILQENAEMFYTKEALKEAIDEYNREVSVFLHYQKQFTKLTGKIFKFAPKKLEYSDFADDFKKIEVEKELERA